MATPPTATPAAEFSITAALVRRLLESQFPHLAVMPLSRLAEGWDNTMFRLGSDLVVRLPRRELGAVLAVTESEWLDRMSAGWTFKAPIPLEVGIPGEGYPWHWSIVPWIEGLTLFDAPLSAQGAAELGAALAQIHIPAPPEAPVNAFRSTPLPVRAHRLYTRLARLEEQRAWKIDTDGAKQTVEAADTNSGVAWCHLDLHGNNVLSADGHLAGIIDWGDARAGDPATDLGQALYLVGSALFQACATAYADAGGPADPAAPRVRAEAVHYAVTMASLDDKRYAASGWSALVDLGLAHSR